MDAALASKGYTALPVPPRADVTPVRAAVPSLLPQPQQSVAAAAEHNAARFDGNDGRFRSRNELPGKRLADEVLREIEREIEFHEETHDLVARTVDRRTGRVINQFPAESLLKLRVYVRAEAARAEADPVIARSA